MSSLNVGPTAENSDKVQILEHVTKRFEDQDFMQRMYVLLIVPLELYRVAISSLLIVFVPQKCPPDSYNSSEHLCTMQENMEDSEVTYKAGLVINFFTLCVFLAMYFVEIRREHLLIEFLEVNPDTHNHSEKVEANLVHLAAEKKSKILSVINQYKYIGGFAIVMYIVNAGISGVIIMGYVLGNQTVFAFVTNVLFMVLKFADVYWTIVAEPHVYLSAYLKTKIQYNDVDPEHRRSRSSQA